MTGLIERYVGDYRISVQHSIFTSRNGRRDLRVLRHDPAIRHGAKYNGKFYNTEFTLAVESGEPVGSGSLCKLPPEVQGLVDALLANERQAVDDVT